jgi:hypothetical protein
MDALCAICQDLSLSLALALSRLFFSICRCEITRQCELDDSRMCSSSFSLISVIYLPDIIKIQQVNVRTSCE